MPGVGKVADVHGDRAQHVALAANRDLRVDADRRLGLAIPVTRALRALGVKDHRLARLEHLGARRDDPCRWDSPPSPRRHAYCDDLPAIHSTAVRARPSRPSPAPRAVSCCFLTAFRAPHRVQFDASACAAPPAKPRRAALDNSPAACYSKGKSFLR